MPDVTAFILAGGRSSRMGEDKAFLPFEGGTLLTRALALVREVASSVVIVGPREKFSALADVLEDVYRDCGPLGGIHAALASSTARLNLVLAVDTPFVAPAFLSYLSEQAEAAAGALVTLPRFHDGWQPLCAVYRKGFAAHAEAALKAGHYKIDALFASVPVRAITEDELRQFAFDRRMFDNLNTPEDWQRAARRAPTS
jgi:molybdenum cofactor guanylyltransferase